MNRKQEKIRLDRKCKQKLNITKLVKWKTILDGQEIAP